LIPNPRFRKLHRGLRRGGQVFMVQPLRGFCLERWILNLNSTIRQFANSTIWILGSNISILLSSYQLFFSVLPNLPSSFHKDCSGRAFELLSLNPRFRKLYRGLRRGRQVFMVQPLRGFCLERWILNLNSTIRQFDNLDS